MIDSRDPRLTAYVLGELDQNEVAAVEQAMEESPELAQIVDQIRRTACLLSDEFAAEPAVGLGREHLEQVAAMAARTETLSWPENFTALAIRHWSWVAAAACLIAMLGYSIFNPPFEVAMQQEVVQRPLEENEVTQTLDPVPQSSSPSIPEGHQIMFVGDDHVGKDIEEEWRSRSDVSKFTFEGRRPSQRVADLDTHGVVETQTGLEQFADNTSSMEGLGAMGGGLGGSIASTPGDDAWGAIGGPGSIEASPDNLSLIISNTQEVHPDSPAGDSGVNLDAVASQSPAEQSVDLAALAYPPATEWGPLSERRASEPSQFDLGRDEDAVRQLGEEDFAKRAVSVQVEAVDGTEMLILRGRKSDSERVAETMAELERAQAQQAQLGQHDAGNASPYAADAPASDETLESRLDQRRVEQSNARNLSVIAGEPELFRSLESQGASAPGATGWFAPRLGDRVDVLVTIDGETRTLLRDLTVAPNMNSDGSSDTQHRGTPVLVRPEQAATLNLAKGLGTLRVARHDPQEEGQKEAGVAEITKQIQENLAANDPPAEAVRQQARAPRTWRRVRAVPNTSRLMVGDKEELEMNGMQVHVQVDGFRARVLVDCFYYNDRDRQLEGKFKLRLPDDASLYYFAFGQSAFDLTSSGELPREEFLGNAGANSGVTRLVSLRAEDIKRDREDVWRNVKEARMVPREKAAFAYSQTVRRRVDPALVEWSGAGVFNANVFPLMPRQLHRIVIGYDVNLTRTEHGLVYELDLPEHTGACQVDLDVSDVTGAEMNVTAGGEFKRTATKGGVHYHIDQPDTDKPVRVTLAGVTNLFLRDRDDPAGDLFATRLQLDLPPDPAAGSSRAVFLVDTSLSSRPDKFNVWLDLLRATLDNNRDSLQEFAVLFFNVENHFWKEEYVENTPENVRQVIIDCQQQTLEGATDLFAATQSIAQAAWITESSSPDLFLLSDGAANWGETNLRLMHQVILNGNLGSLFAYQTGMTGTAIANLRFLASATGGAVFSVANEDEVEKVSTAHRVRPWKLTSIDVEGASDLLTAGRVQWVYPGQSITVVGRLKEGADPADIHFMVQRGDEARKVRVRPDALIETELASRLYGQVAVGQLESLGESVFDVSAAYARHFRITGETCSLLMLETEADYQRFDIRPQEDRFVIKTQDADRLVSSTLNERAAELADPRTQFMAWIQRLEKMPGMEFSMPTALKLVIDQIRVEAISDPLRSEANLIGDLPKHFVEQLSADRLDYDAVLKEAERRGATSSADAIKVISSLIEQNPGDLVLARDIAFSAMEMSRPAQAYHLLYRVARARPYDASIYTALGQCLAQMDKADMAIVFYEIALGAKFQNRQADFRKIAGTEYAHLLRAIAADRTTSNIKAYAQARLDSLIETHKIEETADVLITMMWNTDQSDVDLHVIEPSGEECFYSHPRTRSGGYLTRDITDGFGPEMYTLRKAPGGEYDIWVKYFNTNPNRAGMRSKVYLTIYRDFGSGGESVIRKVVNIKKPGQKERVETLVVK